MKASLQRRGTLNEVVISPKPPVGLALSELRRCSSFMKAGRGPGPFEGFNWLTASFFPTHWHGEGKRAHAGERYLTNMQSTTETLAG